MRRVGELQGLRGVAILLVVAYHAGGIGAQGGGPTGVILFFVLSGYLITAILVREVHDRGRLDVRGFWGRRARRLLPAYGPVAVYVILLFGVVGGGAGAVLGMGIAASAPIADYLRAVAVPLFPMAHTWSLAVEEQFYLVWPFLLPWLVRRRRALRWVLGAVAVSVTWRVLGTALGFGQWTYHALDANAFAILAGAALALWNRRLPAVWGALATAGLVALAWSPLPESWTVIVPPLAALLGVVAVAGAVGVPGMRWAPLRWIGTVSYGWYLWHLALAGMVDERAIGWRWVACGVALGVAALSWYAIEKPVLDRASRRRMAVDSSLAELSLDRRRRAQRLGAAGVGP